MTKIPGTEAGPLEDVAYVVGRSEPLPEPVTIESFRPFLALLIGAPDEAAGITIVQQGRFSYAWSVGERTGFVSIAGRRAEVWQSK